VNKLEVDTLRPLIDLAYWSTFVEVKRDAAAAFATLCMNEANLPVLSDAGTLGALLALVGVSSGKADVQVTRDAATALSHLLVLDEIKLRLLDAPNGLDSVLKMTRSAHLDVKLAAVKALEHLASHVTTKERIVEKGSLKFVLGLLLSREEKIKRRGARVLRKLVESGANQLAVCESPATVESLMAFLLDPFLASDARCKVGAPATHDTADHPATRPPITATTPQPHRNHPPRTFHHAPPPAPCRAARHDGGAALAVPPRAEQARSGRGRGLEGHL
jgi:hypothetical protein